MPAEPDDQEDRPERIPGELCQRDAVEVLGQVHDREHGPEEERLAEQARQRDRSGRLEAQVDPARVRTVRQERQGEEREDRRLGLGQEQHRSAGQDEREDDRHEQPDGLDARGEPAHPPAIGRDVPHARKVDAASGHVREVEHDGRCEADHPEHGGAELPRHVDGGAEGDHARDRVARSEGQEAARDPCVGGGDGDGVVGRRWVNLLRPRPECKRAGAPAPREPGCIGSGGGGRCVRGTRPARASIR